MLQNLNYLGEILLTNTNNYSDYEIYLPPPQKLSNRLVSLLKHTFVFLLLALPFSCHRNSDILPQGLEASAITIEEARNWYESTQKSARVSGKKEKVIWSDAVEQQVNGQQSLVVVPILSVENQLKFSITTDKNGKKKKAEDTFISADVKINLVFSKNGDTIDVLEMRLIRDEDYYLKKKKKKMESHDFDGLLYLFDHEEKLVSGAQFKDGKVVGTIGKKSKGGRTSYVPIEVCTDWYRVTSVGGEIIDWDQQPYDTTCEYVNIDLGSPTPDSGAFSLFMTALQGSLGGGSSSGAVDQLLQLPYISDYWNRLNSYEKDYFRDNFWLLPGAALAFKEAEWFVNLLYCRDDDDGNWNAFKHAYWSAMLCTHVGPFQALIITDIHEYNDQGLPFTTRNEMDFCNNELGINTYKKIKNFLSYLTYPVQLVVIADTMLENIANGFGVRVFDNNGQLTTAPTTSGDRCN